ncbi:MAG: uroporphyrinogen-III C-methyltransferase [Sulfolobaceae archaeon]|nr:uroporphyrinogen-III C-methyltransferase [Sulfolobaceae archaeon]
MSKVVIVGAGPGDPELITLKGLKYIEACDVIIYDKLTEKLIRYARPNCIKYFLADSEEEVTTIKRFIDYGYRLIVRLKNGDPYIFGRGAKLCKELMQEVGVECEVVPGVSAVNSVPAYAGIPLTFQGISNMITIVSAVTEGGRMFEFEKVPSEGTLVVLMAGKRLREVSKALMAKRSPLESVAIIERGTYEDQKVYITRLKDLGEFKPSSPSMLVLGDVVKLREFLWKVS